MNFFLVLLVPKALDRVDPCGSEGLPGNGNQGNRHSSAAGKNKGPPGNGGMIGKILKPFIHDEPPQGAGNDECECNPFQDITVEQKQDI